MHRRRTGQSVHCGTGHNPLRMQGKTRKSNTYYACGYRINYGDKAAHVLGHGKWQYVREDRITDLIDRFFATQIFGPGRAPPRVLVAGVGNFFLGDDGFGVEVAARLARRAPPAGVDVVDYLQTAIRAALGWSASASRQHGNLASKSARPSGVRLTR
jgi:hypothetical protein